MSGLSALSNYKVTKQFTNISAEDQHRGKKRYYSYILLAILIASFLMAVLSQYFLKQYEKSIISIYAEQQDGYVKIVNKQINLQNDRTDLDIIRKILNTLDDSEKTYWTMAKNQSVVYMKNVTETNRYKGVSPATVFRTASARNFLDSLRKNNVTHAIITMDHQKYIASGTEFIYNGKDYHLCLLTNQSILLDDNMYLMAKTANQIMWIATIILFFVVSTVFVMFGQRQNILIKAQTDQIKELNFKIEKINKDVKFNNTFNPQWNVYGMDFITRFVDAFELKDLNKIVFCRINFNTVTDKNQFLEESVQKMDEQILKFSEDTTDYVILLFAKYTEKEAQTTLSRFDTPISKVILVGFDSASTDSYLTHSYRDFKKIAKLK